MTRTARRTVPEIPGVKAKVLDAAASILAAQGVEELSLRAIAETAGIGLASIYHYFANKDELLLSLALEGFGDLRRVLIAARTNPELTPMRGAARAFFAFAQSHSALFSLMFSERLLAGHETLREAEHGVLMAYLDAVRADNRVPPAHQENAAYALWALGRGMAAIIASYPGGPPEELAQKLFAGGAYLINHPE